jgi:hypothetical protein
MGHDSCQALDSGHNLLQIAGLLQTESPTSSPASNGYLIGDATIAYCPQHVKTVMDQARKLSGSTSNP